MDPVVEGQLAEIATFLTDPKPQVRALAIQSLAAYTPASAHAWPFFRKNSAVMDSLIASVPSPDTTHDALKALINLAADVELRRAMDRDDLLSYVVQVATSAVAVETDLACMLLSNLTKDDGIAKKLVDVSLVLQADMTTSDGTPQLKKYVMRVMDRLVQVFSRGEARGYNPNAEFHFLASVFADLPEGRKYFLGSEDRPVNPEEISRLTELPLAFVAAFTEHPSVIRRGGVISTIKNCCFDVSAHKKLLDANEASIQMLPRLLLPLCGPEEFDAEDMEGMPDEIQFLDASKKRESDSVIMRTILEALLLLCSTRHGRDVLRERQVYPVLRVLHLAQDDTDVNSVIDEIVQLLKRDEPDHISTTGVTDMVDDVD